MPTPAPKGNQYAKANSKYKDEYKELAYKYCLLGADDAQLADFFDVCEATINNWKTDHPEFLESLKNGKEVADAEIAQSLYHRAKGYSHPEDKIFNNGGEEMVVATTKHYPPDTAACIIWLKNRQKVKWRDAQDRNVSGPNGGPQVHIIAGTEDPKEASRLYKELMGQ